MDLQLFIPITKIDVAQDPTRLESLRALANERGLPFFAISSVTGEGLEALRYAMAERIFAPRPQAEAPTRD